MHYSHIAKDISGSVTLAIDSMAKQMREDGVDVISFGPGEPDFDTPKNITQAAAAAMEEGFTRYTPSSGIVPLKEAIIKKLKRDNNLDYDTDQIVVCNGAKHALHNAIMAIVNVGDEVILPTPCWISYVEMVKMAGGKPVFVEGDKADNFHLEIAKLEAAITEKSVAIILNSPSNPSGNLYSKETLQQIAALAIKHNLWVISDEVYEYFVYDGKKAISIASLGSDIKERTVVINGVSKAYAMTGWRIGYLACEKKLAKIISNWQSHATSNPNSIAQMAALEALNGNQESVHKMVKEFDERRKLMCQLLNDIACISCTLPEGAFYTMADVSALFSKHYHGIKIENGETFCKLLLEHEAVAVVPGDGFMAPDYIRLSYAVSKEDIQEGIARIGKFCSKLD